MELDYTQGFCPTPNSIYRKEANLTMRESATLTYLLSHKEGFKVSYRRICKDLHTDFRTVKKVIEKLKIKGYEELINKVLLNYNTTAPKYSNNSIYNKNSNTSNTNKKLQHFINNKAENKEKSSLKNFTKNKVLEHISGGAVELQQGCCNISNTRIIIKNNNKELIKEKFKIKINISKSYKIYYPCLPKKEIPYFEEVLEEKHPNEPITIKEDINLKNTADKTTNSNIEVNIQKVNPENVVTKAENLPLTLTEEFLKVGKEINKSIDLYNEYQHFRNNKVNKKHSNSNWISAWKSWLVNGISKYKKGANNLTDTLKEELNNATSNNLTEENTTQRKLEEYYKLYNEAKDWLFNVSRKLEKQTTELFLEKLKLEKIKVSERTTEYQKKINQINKQRSDLLFEITKKQSYYSHKFQHNVEIIAKHKLKGWHDLEKEYLEYCSETFQAEMEAKGSSIGEHYAQLSI